MRNIILFILALFISQTGRAQWEYKGLGHLIINQLTIHEDSIYASTNDGLYARNLFDPDTTWELRSFQGVKVLNTLFLDHDECLVLVETDAVTGRASLFRSQDKGKTSVQMLQDSVYFGYPNLQHMVKAGPGKDTIYLLDFDLKTYDGGQTWSALGHVPQSDNFVYVNPANHSEVFVGGENMMFSAHLQRTADAGQTWQIENTSSVFSGDNALHVMHIIDGDWYASGEGIVVKRDPGSSTWTQLLNFFSEPVWGQYYFGFDYSPADKDIFYVAGDSWAKEKLKLLKSHDRGLTWDTLSYTRPGQMTYGTFDLKVQHVWGEDRVWMGGHGVFTYTQSVPLSVGGIGTEEEMRIYPNPASDRVIVKPGGGIQDQRLGMKIYNISGMLLMEQTIAGRGETVVDLADLAAGVYIVSIEGRERHTIRLIKQ